MTKENSKQNAEESEYTSRKKLLNKGGAIVLGVSIFAVAFFGIFSPGMFQERGPTGPAAKVLGESISEREFSRRYFLYSENIRERAKGMNIDPEAFGIRRMAMDSLINERVTYLQAQKLGVGATQSEVERAIINAGYFNGESGKFDEKLFENFLKSRAYSEASFAEEQIRDMSNQKLNQTISDSIFISKNQLNWEEKLNNSKRNYGFIKIDPSSIKINISDAEAQDFASKEENKPKIKEYFDSHSSDYNKPERVKARHILISFQGATDATGEANKRSKEDAKKLAEKILAEVKSNKQEFKILAAKYTDEPSKKSNGGDLGFFEKEAMVKPFSDAAFALSPGQISEIVETNFGFHIIKVEAKETAVQKTLENETNNIAKILLEKEKAPQLLEQKAASLLSTVQKNPNAPGLAKQIQSEGLKVEETGEKSLMDNYLGSLGGEADVLLAAVSLKKAGEVHASPLKIGESKVILWLKSINQTNPSEPAKTDELENKNYQERTRLANSLLDNLREDKERELKEKKKIWINEAYLKSPNNPDATQGS